MKSVDLKSSSTGEESRDNGSVCDRDVNMGMRWEDDVGSSNSLTLV